jgi:hypothetical protein
MNILERDGLARTGQGHHQDETVVQLGCLANSSYDSVGEWFRHHTWLLVFKKDLAI